MTAVKGDGTRPGVEPDSLREARAALVDEVRELVLAAATSTATEAQLRAMRLDLALTRERLGESPAERAPRPAFEAPRAAWLGGAPYRLSEQNPFGIPLVIEFGEGTATARFVADARHEGPPDSVHGGVSAWLLDCLLGMLMQVRGRRAVTANLDLHYLSRTPLDVPLDLHARILRVDGRKVWIEGGIEAEGVPTVAVEGLFIEVRPPQDGGDLVPTTR